MEKEATCNLEDIYYNMDGETEERHTKQLLNDPSYKPCIDCSYIYNCLFRWFFPSHINSLYE
jgi:hypothetical protein